MQYGGRKKKHKSSTIQHKDTPIFTFFHTQKIQIMTQKMEDLYFQKNEQSENGIFTG
jgi:hypothetical protein